MPGLPQNAPGDMATVGENDAGPAYIGICTGDACTEAVGDPGGMGWNMNGGIDGVIAGSPRGVIASNC